VARLLTTAVLGLFCLATLARAQSTPSERHVVVTLEDGAPPSLEAEGEAWARFLDPGPAGVESRVSARAVAEAEATAPAGVEPARLAALGQVEALLVEARGRAAQLEEAEALALLARALHVAETHPDVPGAAAWIAEVHTAMGLVAAQSGREALMEASLARAATLDPRRVVGAAEARPEVVARARAIAREVATRPSGRFSVRCATPGAQVYLDDRAIGPCGTEVRAPVGRHLLQVRAPGHVPYGGLLDVFEGQRLPVSVALAPVPEVAWARALIADAARDDLADVVQAARSSPLGPVEVWILEPSTSMPRALLTRCDDRGCAEPLRLQAGRAPRASMGVPRAPETVAAALPLARSWLAETGRPAAGPSEAAPWYRRWYVWVPVSVVLVGVATGAAVAARPAPAQQLDITIDFGDLGTGAAAP